MPTVRRWAANAKKVLQRLTAWSFSRWKDYCKCPFLAKCKHVDKLKEPENEHLLRGSEVHSQAEDYVKGKLHKLPKALQVFSAEFKATKKAKALTEQEWAFDDQWRKVDWFSKQAWLRVKVDAFYLITEKTGSSGQGRFAVTTVVIIDYKTGKEREEEHAEQRSLYALAAMLMYPDASRVVVQHQYLDSGAIAEETYTADTVEGLKQLWLKRTRIMLLDTRYKPNPGKHCGWCHFRKENGGPCKF
jgi:CRISPR/Cas system-associated exonuclease Cas4 (RecB family)